MYGWNPTVYKVWAYFILLNMYPLIITERLIERFIGKSEGDVSNKKLFML